MKKLKKIKTKISLKIIISCLFLVIVLVIFLKYISKPINLKTEFSLPSLYVSNNLIKRSDTQETIQLKGVTTMTFCYEGLKTEDLLFRLKKTKTWGINLLGVFISPYEIENRWQELDKIIEWTENNNIYVYLMPAVNIHDDKHSFSDQLRLILDIPKFASTRYPKYNHILYGFWAEPRGLPWVGWLSIMKNVAEDVRKNNNKAVLLFTGIAYGRLTSTDEKIPFNNVIFDLHDYPWANKEDALNNNMKNPLGILWEDIYLKYPVLIGEFGGVYQQDFGSEEDLSYIKFVLNEVNSKKLNYSAYTIDPEGELGLYNWEANTPTKKGALIINDLKKHPPTKFN